MQILKSIQKIKVGDQIRIKKQTFVEKGQSFSLDAGEKFTVEAITASGAVKVTKNYKNGVTKKAMVSKAYYEKA